MKIIFEEKKRTTIAIKVLSSEDVLVSYDPRMGKDKAEAFVKEKMMHICQIQAKIKKQEDFKNSDALYYLGKQYQLIEEASSINEVSFRNFDIVVKHTKSVNPDLLFNKYIDETTLKLFKEQYNKRLLDFPNLDKPKLIIKKMKSSWGYCNHRKHVVCLNSALIMAPIVCIDYVVVHELLHFTYPNHQKAFHDHLEAIIPHHRKIEKELKSFGFLLK